MKVLVLNAGSASLRFEVIAARGEAAPEEQRSLLSGLVEGIGSEATLSLLERKQVVHRQPMHASEYGPPARELLAWLHSWPGAAASRPVEAVGHRVVHGGCQGWLQGYLLSGRHGLFPCYEAFAPIVDSMLNQYAKFLKVSAEISWRRPVSSLTYLLSSEGWRQDHNGYSHQGPGFINNLLTKKARHVRIYLPPDTNCLLSTIDHCLTSTDKIILVIASKQPMPQWLSMPEADEHCRNGASIWRWASTREGEEPEVVLASAGVYPTQEVMAAAWLLRREVPGLRVRVVNVTDLLILEPESHHPHGLTQAAFEGLFTRDKPVIFNFHGYPEAVEQLLFHRLGAFPRFQINGYIEEGTTTTPFDLFVQNRASRYHVLMQAVRAAAGSSAHVAEITNGGQGAMVRPTSAQGAGAHAAKAGSIMVRLASSSRRKERLSKLAEPTETRVSSTTKTLQ
jgi:xylulose-5-phosphate/fructose-6-phosphate phosphoketolase